MQLVVGDRFTQADLWLFPTAVRFDAVYATLFKCTRRRIRDYPHIQAWLKDVWRLSVSERSSKVHGRPSEHCCNMCGGHHKTLLCGQEQGSVILHVAGCSQLAASEMHDVCRWARLSHCRMQGRATLGLCFPSILVASYP